MSSDVRPSRRLIVGTGGSGRTYLLRCYIIDDGGVPFDFNSTFHMHVFGNSVDPITAGQPGGASVGGGAWVVWDSVDGFQGAVNEITLDGILPEKLCIRVANFDHTLESLDSGNCIPIEITGYLRGNPEPQPQCMFRFRNGTQLITRWWANTAAGRGAGAFQLS